MKPLRSLIVVCARAGSERLPRKNFLRVAGTPEFPVRVCDYAIRAAKKACSQLADASWCISSDDTMFCREEPNNLVLRPSRLCTAKASIHLALKHALRAWEQEYGDSGFNAVISLQANVVTVTPEIVTQVEHLLEKFPKATAVMTVKPAECPPEWMFHWGKHRRFIERQATSKRFRMQDLPQRYVPTGTCCAVRREVLMGCKSSAAFKWLGDSILPAIENGTVIEIHDRIDLDLARAWLNRPAQWEDGK